MFLLCLAHETHHFLESIFLDDFRSDENQLFKLGKCERLIISIECSEQSNMLRSTPSFAVLRPHEYTQIGGNKNVFKCCLFFFVSLYLIVAKHM